MLMKEVPFGSGQPRVTPRRQESGRDLGRGTGLNVSGLPTCAKAPTPKA